MSLSVWKLPYACWNWASKFGARFDKGRTGPLILCLSIGSVASVSLGQDANWDLRNYHLYNPFAFLNDRFWSDLIPAGLQTNFNPLLDLPYYFLATGPLAASPRLMAAAAGLPYGILLFATLCLARWVLSSFNDVGRLLPWIAVALGGTAAATASEIGTTFNDIPTAALIIGALAIGGPACIERLNLWRVGWAGAMVGTAVALKLTCAVYAPAVLAAFMVAAPNWRARLQVFVAFSLPSAFAVLIIGGPWALALYQRFGNPIFPLLNSLFRSEWYPPQDFFDRRFFPRTTLQAWLYPWWWTQKNEMLVSENPFRDARLALAMLALPLVVVSIITMEVGRRRPLIALLAASTVGYLAWLRTFSILRYAVVLEALAAVIIIAAIAYLCHRTRRAAPVLAAVVLVALLLHTQILNWWRTPFGSRVFEVEQLKLPEKSLVLAVGAPVAAIIPFLEAPGFRAVGITHTTLEARGFKLFDESMRLIRSHEGPIFALVPGVDILSTIPTEAGLTFAIERCRPIRNNISFNAPIYLCPMQVLRS